MHSINHAKYLEAACEIASEASAILMRYFEGDYELVRKADCSPVTSADLEANALIVSKLIALDPEITVVAEEDALPDVAVQRFWLVDANRPGRAYRHWQVRSPAIWSCSHCLFPSA